MKGIEKKIKEFIGCIITDFAIEIGYKAGKNDYNKAHEKCVKKILKVIGRQR